MRRRSSSWARRTSPSMPILRWPSGLMLTMSFIAVDQDEPMLAERKAGQVDPRCAPRQRPVALERVMAAALPAGGDVVEQACDRAMIRAALERLTPDEVYIIAAEAKHAAALAVGEAVPCFVGHDDDS